MKNRITALACSIVSILPRCTVNHRDTPSIKIDAKECLITSIDSNYYIDSISFETNFSDQLFYLKRVSYYSNQVDFFNSTSGNFSRAGNYDSVCKDVKPVIKIFLKGKNSNKIFYASTYYNCRSDSIVILKCVGAI